MTQLLTRHPKSEYDTIRIIKSPRDRYRDLNVTKTITPKSRHVTKSMTAIDTAVKDLPVVVPAGRTGFVPWRTAEKSTERKVKSIAKRYGVGSTETPDSSSDIDSHIDTEYRDLPGTQIPEIEKKQEVVPVCDDQADLISCLYRERAEREREAELRADCEAKYKQLSLRISTLENILQAKDDQIQSLIDEKDGNVLVEENLLRTIEQSFSKFQGFLAMLNELGLSELTEMAEFKELNDLAQFPSAE